MNPEVLDFQGTMSLESPHPSLKGIPFRESPSDRLDENLPICPRPSAWTLMFWQLEWIPVGPLRVCLDLFHYSDGTSLVSTGKLTTALDSDGTCPVSARTVTMAPDFDSRLSQSNR